MAPETVTVTLETADDSDELTVPSGLIDILKEAPEETATEVVGDIAMMGFAQRIHGAVHHAEGEPDEEIQALDDATMDLFEERFGATFDELTGHSH
jgi:hypothetical protein